MAKREVLDDDGNRLTPPDPQSEVAQIMYLLEWGRRQGFQIGPMVQVGETVLQVVDLRQSKQNAAPKAEGSIWKDHGHDE